MSDKMKIDVELVRELAALLDETKLTEIEVEEGDRKIKVARAASGGVVAMPAPVAAPAAAAAAAAPPVAAQGAPASAPTSDHPGAVKSPMVGTAYLSPDPEAPAFVSIGDTVKEGETLLIIEAMKVMNPIAAPRGGKVTQMLVGNGQPVEFDQPLVVIE